jgi:hypothetical protein
MSVSRSTAIIAFWTATALFCLQIGFTAYAQLTLPQVAEAFTRLGFPAYFRMELAWAKLLGVVLLCRRGSRSGPTRASRSPSALRSLLTWRSEKARRRGAGRWARACSGGCRTSSGAACRGRRPAPGNRRTRT